MKNSQNQKGKKKTNKLLVGCLIVLAAFAGFILLVEFLFSFSLTGKAQKGDIAAVKKALEKGANVNEGWGMFNYTPLHAAADSGQREMVKFLLDNGALTELREYDSGWTALVFALKNRHFKTAELLIERGADPQNALSGGRFDNKTEKEAVDFLNS